jgi:hypothetical protein
MRWNELYDTTAKSNISLCRAFFNYISGGGGGGGGAKSLFSKIVSKTLEEKWNLEERFDILVTEIALWMLCPVFYF